MDVTTPYPEEPEVMRGIDALAHHGRSLEPLRMGFIGLCVYRTARAHGIDHATAQDLCNIAVIAFTAPPLDIPTLARRETR